MNVLKSIFAVIGGLTVLITLLWLFIGYGDQDTTKTASETPAITGPPPTSPSVGAYVPPPLATPAAPTQAPMPFAPKDPVRARAALVFGPTPIPGAIICADHDQVQLMIDLYKAHFKEEIENQVVGNQMNLIRGTPSPAPDLKALGCVLVNEGTLLDRTNTLGPAVQVEWIDAAGKHVKGVTDYFMIEDAPVSENKKDQSSSIGGTSVRAAPEAELPELANTPDLDCSTDHRGCTDAEFAKVLSHIKTQWSQMPQSVRNDCRSNSTAFGMEDCIIDKTLNWQQEHPSEKPTWIP